MGSMLPRFLKASKVIPNNLIRLVTSSVVCGAPDVYLTYAQSKITNASVHVAAQNCYKEAKGAFTGETSADFLKYE